jgi:hypothetical protein
MADAQLILCVFESHKEYSGEGVDTVECVGYYPAMYIPLCWCKFILYQEIYMRVPAHPFSLRK